MTQLQNIIDNASSLELIRNRITAQTVTRSGRLKSQEVQSGVPWRMRITYNRPQPYAELRGLLAQWEDLNITTSYTDINIGSTNPGLAYITQYQGDLTSGQLAGVKYAQSVGTGASILVDTTGTTGSGVLFRQGDLISVDGFDDVYEVTQNVNFSSNAALPVPVHRGFINRNPGLTGLNLKVGTDVRWEMRLMQMPRYQIVAPNLVQFQDPIEIMEVL